eukprot:TRINITY_DN55_c0_g2_i1.p1 TRINITY_DN55_c0_g2~~TRINITY_DN55_c0_g2_i1.p1  ORF type:complete len:342 (-),score=-1.80 TRINITY_DN55_c0_g2_i1:521-1546(-)
MGTLGAWHLSAFTIVLIAAVCVQEGESQLTLEITVHVDGSTSLPDPSSLNAFLRNQSGLPNPLLPDHPPVQLQLCTSSVYSQPFDFYTLQHPGGCASAPGLLRSKPRAASALEAIWLAWAAVLLAGRVLIGVIRSRMSATDRADCASRCCSRLVPVRAERLHMQTAKEVAMCISQSSACITFVAIIPALFLCSSYVAIDNLLPAPLPDPASLNVFLHSSGENVTLSLCTIRKAFQVYIGFSDSCNQVSNSLYPELEVSPARVETAGSTYISDLHDFSHGVPVAILTFFAGWITCLSWANIAVGSLAYFAGIVYFCCCGRSTRAKVHDVEMQDAASSSGLVG